MNYDYHLTILITHTELRRCQAHRGVGYLRLRLSDTTIDRAIDLMVALSLSQRLRGLEETNN